MPIYAFECGSCGHQFDRLQKLSDPDPTDCPSCDATQLRRQVTAPSFRLAGSGWYETDFKKDGDKQRNLVDKGESAKPADSAGEAKPAVKTDAPAPTPAPAPAASKPASDA